MPKERKKSAVHKNEPETPGTPDVRRIASEYLIRYDFLVLFLVLFLAYNTVSRMTMSGDTNPAAFLPLALILNKTVFFDAFIGAGLGPGVAYAFPLVGGHYVSLFPIVTPVLITPVYLVSYLLYAAFQVPFGIADVMILAKTAASIIAALSGVFVYIAAKQLFRPGTALATALVYAFATSTWSVSSQALWQHGTVELLLIILILLVIRNEREPSRLTIVLLGLVSGLFAFNRPPDAVLLIPVIGYLAWYEQKSLPVYGLSAAISGLPFLLYNLLIFGNVFGGYQENLGFFAFGPESILHFAGLLLAPNVGLLVFSPVLILSIFGYLRLDAVKNPRLRQVLFVFGPVILLEILVYSFFGQWESSVAYSYGQRFLTGFLPVLAIYTGIVLDGVFAEQPGVPKVQAVRALVIILVASSVFIQAIGIFLYPLLPDRSTSSERTWDWTSSIVMESFQSGISSIDSVTMYTFPPLPPLVHFTIRSTGPPSR